MKKTIQRAGSPVLMASVATGVIILVLGLLRYGGPEGLWRRAQAEIAGHLPHPEYVPTPFAAEGSSAFEFTSTRAKPDAAPVGGSSQAAVGPADAEASAAASVASSPLFRGRVANHQVIADRRPIFAPVAQAGEPREVTEGDAESLHSRKPTATPIPPTVTPIPPTATAVPLQPAASPSSPTKQLNGLAHYWQTWNNCGPATLAMNLSYFGVKPGQEGVAAVLRPYRDDKNVSPWEMADYARSQGLRAVARVNGDAGRLRALLDAGVPVLIETWYEPEPNDGMGHYRLVVGYDDPAQEWILYDSYESGGVAKDKPYAGIRYKYDKLDWLWYVFNRAYVVVYDEARAATVEGVIGADLDDAAMWQRSLATAESAAQANPQDAFAWFNVGSSLVALGDYGRAAQAFDQARNIRLPWRMLWYQFAPFRAYYEVGRYDEIIALADATLQQAKSIEELFFWRGRALQAKGDVEGARAAWQRALEFNGNYAEARTALAELP